MTSRQGSGRRGRSAHQRYKSDVAAYVQAGGDESVQRVITAVSGVQRRLGQWYARQLSELELSQGEWTVLSRLATCEEGEQVTPTQLADATNIAPSSMTHRLDRMSERGLISRTTDPDNRTRVLISLTEEGWQLFTQAVREANLVESDVLAPLSQGQREELANLLEIVITGLEEAEAEEES
ncbi:MAG TPA: MarR family transcriptional regulator [Segeticoccus sp.]|uniref:MarR family winged helix-turn-helix transcriptional regulator n=1 Tax=Segeticoccus sp. TaxID=2706531 RepID=UPI002D7FE5A6|nr:MarR family transcriptional regulator [Segeticoccus sp.]HET8601381.1 MarR family transcriptional regulator [Segeticoccus sp.]